jgi:hypothetical protein
MAGDPDRPTWSHVDIVRLLERAIAAAERRRRYRLALAVATFAALATLAALGLILVANH